MSRSFGWEYPPGVSGVPGDEDELCAWCGGSGKRAMDGHAVVCECLGTGYLLPPRPAPLPRSPTVEGARMMFAAMDEARASRCPCACGCQDASWRDDPQLDGMRRYECDECFNRRKA